MNNDVCLSPIVVSALGGIVGCLLTLCVSFFSKVWNLRRELRLLKVGLFVDFTHAIDEITSCVGTYSRIYENNEYRVDDSMLISAKEKLVSRIEEPQLLLRVSKSLSSVQALNKLLDFYRNQCLAESEHDQFMCSSYIHQLNRAVLNAFKQTVSSLADLGSYAEPKRYAERLKGVNTTLAAIRTLRASLEKELCGRGA